MLQKVCYFADFIANLGLGFKPHYYGSFSPLVEQSVSELKGLGFVEEETLGFGVVQNAFFGEVRRYDYKLTLDGSTVVEEVRRCEPEQARKISEIVDRIRESGNPDYRELSIAAKTLFIAKSQNSPITPAEIERQARSVGWDLPNEAISKAVELLKKLRIVRVNSPG